jgi:hypothetical protein
VRNTANSSDNTPLLAQNSNPIPLQQPSNPPLTGWYIEFVNNCAATLFANPGALIERGERFFIRLDAKGPLFAGIRSDSDGNYYIINRGIVPPRSNGLPPNANAGYMFQIYRQPQRVGQPLELPQGIVIDVGYSGIGTGPVYAPPSNRILVMFSPNGSVVSVSLVDQDTGEYLEETGTSNVHFLVGKTEKIERPWNINRIRESNICDGSNLWVTVNRRTGSVATVENTPSFNPQDFNPPQNFPPTSNQERQNFLTRAREFAITGEVKGGQ